LLGIYATNPDESLFASIACSFALAYIENGGDPFSLQRILGHTNQTTTSKYVSMARNQCEISA